MESGQYGMPACHNVAQFKTPTLQQIAEHQKFPFLMVDQVQESVQEHLLVVSCEEILGGSVPHVKVADNK
jgi:hypothetical protein